MELSADNIRSSCVIIVTSCTAMTLVFSAASLSILLVISIKSVIQAIIHFIALISEVFVAVIAAITSGTTVTLAVLLATGASTLTFSASAIHSRVILSMVIGAGSVFTSALALMWFSSMRLDTEIEAALISAAAMSVALASGWAIGVLSLIEKETQQVGLKMTSMLDAVRNNNYRVLYLLVKLHFGLKQEDLDLALIHAVKCGYLESTLVLLKAGANPNAQDSYENTPLSLSCETGMYDIALGLVENGANVNVVNGGKATPLHNASKWGYEGCVDLLISHNAFVNVQDGLWRTPLMLAAKHATEPDAVLLKLIKAGADVNMIGCERRTVFHYVASRGKAVSVILKAEGNPHIKDGDGNIPLHYAANEGHCDVVQQLVEIGCDVNSFNNENRTPLHMASMGGCLQCVEFLLRSGALASFVDTSGHLPVYYAICYGHTKIVISFLMVNSPLEPKFTNANRIHLNVCPLFCALENRHFKTSKLLMLAGCKSDIFTKWLLDQPSAILDQYTDEIRSLQKYMQQPLSLMHCSRLVIRSMIGLVSGGLSNLCLPLPKVLKEYIMMRELSKQYMTESTKTGKFEKDTFMESEA